MGWDLDKIKSVIPHREPFLFIDEIVWVSGTQNLVAIKTLKADEAYFKGHFPGNPLMPGVLIVEAMAQASIILFALDKPEIADSHPNYYLGKVKAEFLNPVFPGARLNIEVQKVKFLNHAAITDTVVKVDSSVAARASLVFSIQKNE